MSAPIPYKLLIIKDHFVKKHLYGLNSDIFMPYV